MRAQTLDRQREPQFWICVFQVLSSKGDSGHLESVVSTEWDMRLERLAGVRLIPWKDAISLLLVLLHCFICCADVLGR